jgi:hypothetical protein
LRQFSDARTILSVLQAIGIVVLIVHVYSDDDRSVQRGAHELPVATTAPSPIAARADDVVLVNEQRLRDVIREELAQLQGEVHARVSHTQDSAARPAVTAQPRDDSARRAALDTAAQQFENYRAMGAISDAQMVELQAAIAKVDAAGRRQIMGRLIRALNSGELKGRL